MARYRIRRFRRRLRGRNGRLAASAVAAGLVLAVIAGHAHPGSSGVQASAAASSDVALGQRLAGGYGWGSGGEWTCLDELWTRESGWSATAANPASDARGIAQDISGWSASYQYGNAPQQIGWGLSYIRGRYGDPCTAWNHETADGWY
jgi:resuscitation-promoting factor RpfB